MQRVREAEEPGENLRTDRDPRLTLSGRVQSWRLWV